MDKLVEKKILEAKEHVQTAEKRFIFRHLSHVHYQKVLFNFRLKTSLFKRTPDYDTAASEYNKAGYISSYY